MTSAMAAEHLGFMKDGKPNVVAFAKWIKRERRRPHTRLRIHWLVGRMRFRQVDLDKCVEPEPQK